LPGDTKKGKPKGKSVAREIAESFGSDGQWAAGTSETGVLRQSISSKWSKGSSGPSGDEYVNMVVEKGILGSDIVGSLNTSDAKMISTQYVNENKCVVEPYVKSRRAQTSTDDETWVHGEVNPTLNSFDVGDTRSTTVVVGSLQARDYKGVNHEGARDGKLIIEQPMLIDGTRVDDVRVYEPPVQTLGARMGTGGNNVPNVMQPEPTMAVRRLTPLECERLMGWPDDHTRYKADGTEQADTHRYKQCGNGVASPVARWVAEQIAKVEHAEG
jgi:site-specific DNA-cytosine methylase